MELFDPIFVTGNQFSVVGLTSLSEEDAAVFLRAYGALWHPSILACALSLPKIVSEFNPQEAISKTIAIAADRETAERLGPAFFSGEKEFGIFLNIQSSDFQEKYQSSLRGLNVLMAGDAEVDGAQSCSEINHPPGGDWAAFRGLGLGLAWVDALYEAQNHSNLVDREGLLAACKKAAAAWLGGEEAQAASHMKEAAELLVHARTQVVGGTPRIIESADWDEALAKGAEAKLPESIRIGLKGAIFASGETLLVLEREFPKIIGSLKEKRDSLEVCGGRFFPRKDSLRPLASQFWNLREGQNTHKKLLGEFCKVVVHFADDLHPVLPALWRQNALSHGILKGNFSEAESSRWNGFSGRTRVSIVSWSCGDGMGLETLVRQPLNGDSATLGLDLAYHFQQSQSLDYCPILHLKSPEKGPGGWYGDFLELCRLAPVMGEHGIPSEVLKTASPGDYWSTSTADELMPDQGEGRAIIPELSREWRRSRQELQAEWVFVSLLASLQGSGNSENGEKPSWAQIAENLGKREFEWEKSQVPGIQPISGPSLAAGELAKWIVSRGAENTPGWLLLNPCGFLRRAIAHWPETVSMAENSSIKAVQIEADGTTNAVIEVPPYGFCWLPRKSGMGAVPRPNRTKLADERGVRNEFLEADIDLATGDIRGIRDARQRKQKVSVQVFGGLGNVMVGKEVRVLSQGPARGEVESFGELVLANGEKVGEFSLRLKAWLGRPLLEVFAKVDLGSKNQGEPFLRVSWKDPAMDLKRGWMGQNFRLRDENQLAGDWVEIAEGASSTTTLIPMDFPWCKRQGKRALDFPMGKSNPKVGEVHAFGIALDRDFPFLLAQGAESPLPAIAVNNGPPPSGANGWLAMLDHAEMVVADVRPTQSLEEFWLNWQMVSSSQEGFELGFSMAKVPDKAAVVDAVGQEVRTLDLDANGMRVFVQRMEWLGIGTKLK